MGIRKDEFLAPALPTLVAPDSFERLVVALPRERVVRTPWALLAGTLCVNASLNWARVSGMARWDRPLVGTVLRTKEMPEDLRDDDPLPWGDSHEKARLLAAGERILDVLPALRAAPYGSEDIAVAFRPGGLRQQGGQTTLLVGGPPHAAGGPRPGGTPTPAAGHRPLRGTRRTDPSGSDLRRPHLQTHPHERPPPSLRLPPLPPRQSRSGKRQDVGVTAGRGGTAGTAYVRNSQVPNAQHKPQATQTQVHRPHSPQAARRSARPTHSTPPQEGFGRASQSCQEMSHPT